MSFNSTELCTAVLYFICFEKQLQTSATDQTPYVNAKAESKVIPICILKALWVTGSDLRTE